MLALYERVFRRPISREHWRWKLVGRGDPIANVWVVEIGGRLVFQYAGIPTRVQHCGRECWAMVSVDTMADPVHRGRGLLTRVATAAYDHWRKAGVPFVLGLPNEQWGSRAAALGWTPVGELRWWVRYLDPLGLLHSGMRIPWSRHFGSATEVISKRKSSSAVTVSAVDDANRLAPLWTLIADEGVIRDSAWFRWRYLDAIPTWNILGVWKASHLVGGATFRLDANEKRPSGVFGEVLAPDFDVLEALLDRSCEQLRAMGAVRAALLIQRGTPLEEAALATHFTTSRWAFSVQAVDLGGGLPRAALFQGSDFDVV